MENSNHAYELIGKYFNIYVYVLKKLRNIKI